MAAPVDPNEALILQSIAASKPAAAPQAGAVSDPNEALILGSIKNHGKPQDPNSIGDKTGDAFRTREDMALSEEGGVGRFLSGLGQWFQDHGGRVTEATAGTKGPDGSYITPGAPVDANALPNPNAAEDAALSGSAEGAKGYAVGTAIPVLAGGAEGGKLAGSAADAMLPAAKQGLRKFATWLAGASMRGAGAGAGAGVFSPADSPTQRLKNTAGGAATGTLLGPVLEGGINATAAAPSLVTALRQKLAGLKPAEIDQLVANFLHEQSTQTPEEAQAAIDAAPKVPGFKPTTAAATADPGLQGAQAQMRAKSAVSPSPTAGIFQQQVDDNDAAIREGMGELAPNSSNIQVSTAAVDRLRSIGEQEKAGVEAAYAPFDAVKAKVHIPTATVLDPADKVYSGLSTAERNMIPQSILDRIYKWGEYAPFKEVEGEMTALSNAASNAMATGNNNAARVIGDFRKAMNNGLNSVDTIHNAAGDEIGNFSSMNEGAQGQAPLQAFKAGRAANVAYRQRFPSQGGDNTPDQNTVAKIISGDIFPSEALTKVMNSPEQTAAFLKAAGDDPRVKLLMVNHAVNDLVESSRGSAGQLSGDRLIRNIASNRASYKQFMSPAQLSALDTLSNAARMNNAAKRRALPGESGTAVLNAGASNMADFVARAAMPVAEHAVPGFNLGMKLLSQFKTGSGDEGKFTTLLTQALMDPPTYIRLRNMPVNQNTVGIVRKLLLDKATPAAISLGTSLTEQSLERKSAAAPANQ